MKRRVFIVIATSLLAVFAVIFCLSACSGDGSPSDTAEVPEVAVLTYSSFDGGGPEYFVEIADGEIVSYDEEHVYRDKNHESQRGSGYEVVLTFKGLKQGITAMQVKSVIRSEVEFVEYYEIVVDRSLNVYMTQVDYAPDTEETDDVTEPEPESTESAETPIVTDPVTAPKETKEETDPYNAKDYATPDDFYYDYYDDFYDYDEAEEYWEDHCD